MHVTVIERKRYLMLFQNSRKINTFRNRHFFICSLICTILLYTFKCVNEVVFQVFTIALCVIYTKGDKEKGEGEIKQ